MAYIVGDDIPCRVAVDLDTNRVALTAWLLVEQVCHDAALIDVCAIDACHSCVDVVVHYIQLQAALCDRDAAVHSNKVTLGHLEPCRAADKVLGNTKHSSHTWEECGSHGRVES